ncbi:MAG: hypothetical protein HYZ44_12430 [Bacteroidetes bacterium]|nr:hypothetical protein [Bacteroidota bacterium]
MLKILLRLRKALALIRFRWAIIWLCAIAAHGQEASKPKATLVITPRFNSAGFFPFSGAIINDHINFDLNVFYEHKGYGFFLFKSFDLVDTHSIVNYLQPGIFKKININSTFYLRGFVGYVFSQTTEFRDKDSDYFTSIAGYWAISEKLKLENTALFFDLSQSAKLANRLLVTYQLENFRFDVYVWQRIVFETNQFATSASLAVNFPKIKLTDGWHIQNTISYQGYLTETKPDWAMRQGLLVSIALPISPK